MNNVQLEGDRVRELHGARAKSWISYPEVSKVRLATRQAIDIRSFSNACDNGDDDRYHDVLKDADPLFLHHR